MFGRNPQRSQDMAPDGRLEIQDVFPTIQGEGPHAGRSAIFVRVAGCNLACWFCDTDFESAYTSELISDPTVGVATLVKSIQEIAAERRHPPTLVVITGGEPCRQNIVPLIKALVAEHFEVQVETTGALWPFKETPADLKLQVVISPKTPKVNKTLAEAAGCWKYIVKAGEQDPDDGLPIMSTQEKGKAQRLARPWDYTFNAQADVCVQPMDEQEEAATIANVRAAAEAAMEYGYKLSVQIHKVVGLP